MAAKSDYILSYFPHTTNQPSVDDAYAVSSIDQLMPATRYYLEHGMQIEEGEQVLIANDSTMGDPMILDAWARAARERGATVDILTLDLKPHRTPPEQGPMGSAGSSWWPTWLEHAVLKADATIVLTPLNLNHGIKRQTVEEKWNRGRIGLPGNLYTREQLAFTNWTTFPAELDVALQRGLYRQTDVDAGPKRFRITDPLGTDLTFTQDVDRDWIRESFAYDLNRIEVSLTHRSEYMFHHNKIAPGLSKTPDAEGVIVTNSLATGPIELMTLHLEHGQIVRVEGDGPEAEEWRHSIEELRDVDYGFPHGKGVAWATGVYIGTHPKVVRPDFFNPDYFDEQGSYNYWWCDIKRAGFVHIGFSKGWSGLDGMERDLPAWHADAFMPYTNVEVDGEPIVENGHLCLMDDPEIRAIAEQHGDPDELLTEQWLPSYEQDPTFRDYTQADYDAIARAFKRGP